MFAMFSMQSYISLHFEEAGKCIHNPSKNKSSVLDLGITEIIELADKGFKTVANVCKNLKANTNIKKRNRNYDREPK